MVEESGSLVRNRGSQVTIAALLVWWSRLSLPRSLLLLGCSANFCRTLITATRPCCRGSATDDPSPADDDDAKPATATSDDPSIVCDMFLDHDTSTDKMGASESSRMLFPGVVVVVVVSTRNGDRNMARS